MSPGQARATPAHTPAAARPASCPPGGPEAPQPAQGCLLWPHPRPGASTTPGPCSAADPPVTTPCLSVPAGSRGCTNIWRHRAWSWGVSTHPGRTTLLPAPTLLPCWAGVPRLGAPGGGREGVTLLKGGKQGNTCPQLPSCCAQCPPSPPHGPSHLSWGPRMGWSLPVPPVSMTGLRGTGLHRPQHFSFGGPWGRVWGYWKHKLPR